MNNKDKIVCDFYISDYIMCIRYPAAVSDDNDNQLMTVLSKMLYDRVCNCKVSTYDMLFYVTLKSPEIAEGIYAFAIRREELSSNIFTPQGLPDLIKNIWDD